VATFVLLYLPIVVAICLSLWCRQSPFARLVSVALICFPASLHAVGLLTAHRIVMLGEKSPPEPGTPYGDAVTRIQAISQSEIIPFLAIVFGLALLALLPRKSCEK
jgi:hypothetical protein